MNRSANYQAKLVSAQAAVANIRRGQRVFIGSGAAGGIITVLIRNIGVYADGVIYAILVINLIQPLVDKIRPQAVGKVV